MEEEYQSDGDLTFYFNNSLYPGEGVVTFTRDAYQQITGTIELNEEQNKGLINLLSQRLSKEPRTPLKSSFINTHTNKKEQRMLFLLLNNCRSDKGITTFEFSAIP